MKYLLIVLLLCSFSCLAQMNNLMPQPKKVNGGPGRFTLDKNFEVRISSVTESRLNAAAIRMLFRLDGRTGLFITKYLEDDADTGNAPMVIEIARKGRVTLGEDESYSLIITPAIIRLTAETDLGAMHGLETLLQLLTADDSGYYFPAVEISDEPRFKWRGLLMDVARHWMPVEVIKRNLDGMAAVKMNVLHLHLTEDQGFRIESKVFPRLHELGSNGDYFTQEQMRDIIQYADARGIRVVPEFDLPGHATSWFVGYPKLASTVGPYKIETTFGVMNSSLDPTKEETYKFIDLFFKEMCELFPDDYFHIGGDENNGKQWDANEDIQQFMVDNEIDSNHELQSYFNTRLLEILTKYGKTMVGWDEILQPGMPKNIMIQSWRGRESLYEAAKKGYQVLLSNGYYIDLCRPARHHYLNDPLPSDAPLTNEEMEYVLGGEATMWAELVTPETVDSRIWPRTIAIAERLWSPSRVDDVDDMYRRLEVTSRRLEEVGIMHLRNQDMMLRRMAGGNDIAPLRTLIDVVEPLKVYSRHSQGLKYTTHLPLTRIADAAFPESSTARLFLASMKEFLADPDSAKMDDLMTYLVPWMENHEHLAPTIERSHIIGEALMLSANLSAISQVAMEAIGYQMRDEVPPTIWKAKARKTIEEAKKPYMEAELAVVSAIEMLVNMVGDH